MGRPLPEVSLTEGLSPVSGAFDSTSFTGMALPEAGSTSETFRPPMAKGYAPPPSRACATGSEKRHRDRVDPAGSPAQVLRERSEHHRRRGVGGRDRGAKRARCRTCRARPLRRSTSRDGHPFARVPSASARINWPLLSRVIEVILIPSTAIVPGAGLRTGSEKRTAIPSSRPSRSESAVRALTSVGATPSRVPRKLPEKASPLRPERTAYARLLRLAGLRVRDGRLGGGVVPGLFGEANLEEPAAGGAHLSDPVAADREDELARALGPVAHGAGVGQPDAVDARVPVGVERDRAGDPRDRRVEPAHVDAAAADHHAPAAYADGHRGRRRAVGHSHGSARIALGPLGHAHALRLAAGRSRPTSPDSRRP